MDRTLTLVMAGGQGKRLRPLTDERAKPAVPFAGRRLIDYTLENCVRARVGTVVVLVQYRAPSITRHLRERWSGRLTLRVFSAEEAGRPFRGTADAVRLALRQYGAGDRVLVLAGDHVYRMDYRELAQRHAAAEAEATIAVVPVPRLDARAFGVPEVRDGLVTGFLEKPDDPPAWNGHPELSLASMGIYLFDRPALAGYLADHAGESDFGHDVVPGMVRAGHRVAAHAFGDGGYWRDIGDVDAYHGALMDLVCDAGTRSWVDAGARVEGSVERSVVGKGVVVEPGAEVVECVLLDGARVGANARLRRAVVEKNVRVPPGIVLGWGDWTARPATPGGILVVRDDATGL